MAAAAGFVAELRSDRVRADPRQATVDAQTLRLHAPQPKRCSFLSALRHCSELGRISRPWQFPPGMGRVGSSARSACRRERASSKRPQPSTSHAQAAADARRAMPRAVPACQEPAAPATPRSKPARCERPRG
eukprot:scaffold16570_cov64-Phaeocystis_antarctica.AAC.5